MADSVVVSPAVRDDNLPGLKLTREEAEAVLRRLADGRKRFPSGDGQPGPSADRPRADRSHEPAGPHPERHPAGPAAESRPLSADVLGRVLEAMPDALVVIDRDGRIVLVNSQTEKLFGYRRAELIGRPVEVLVPERFRKQHAADRARYAAAPQPEPRAMGGRGDLWARRKDGHEVPVEISLSPLPTDEGLLFVSSVREVSQRRRDEARLRQMEARYRTLVEGIPAVTFMAALGEEAKELYVSPQLEQLLGFSQKEWLENPVLWYTQLHPDDRQRWHTEFARTCATGEPFHAVYRFLSRDGRVVWVQGEAKVVCDEDGRPLFLQGVAFDITGMKEAEAELNRRVTERTADLTRALADLGQKTEELEQFAYVASHDLREPLRTLVNYPQRLLKEYGDQFDPRAQDWVNRTIDGARRMRELIDDLAQYSRVVRRDRTFTPVDTAAVCAEACANLQAAAAQSAAELTVGELPTVMGNDRQLMLLFQNLIGNAIKFCAPDRPARVAVGARPDGDGWLFWVRDNGIGIEARYLERIFGLGERLHPSSKYPGTGFGLAICEKIVLGHGGRIWAESEPGQGSTFFFTLPAAQ
jgi:PAS domain S-box-containing protein